MRGIIDSIIWEALALALTFVVAFVASIIVGGVVSVFMDINVFDQAVIFGVYAVVGLGLLIIANAVIDFILSEGE